MSARKRSQRLRGVRGIAGAYGVSPSTASRWVSLGAIPHRWLASGAISAERVPRAQIAAALERMREERAEQRRAERAAVAKMFGGASRRRERELGIPPETVEGADIAALVVNIFAPEHEVWDVRHAVAARELVLDRLLRALGGTRSVPPRSDGTPDPWRGVITFPRSVTETEILLALDRADFRGLKGRLRRARVHFGLMTSERVFVPLTFAHSDPRVTLLQARASLDRGGAMIDSEKNRRALSDRRADRERWRTKKARQRAHERKRRAS